MQDVAKILHESIEAASNTSRALETLAPELERAVESIAVALAAGHKLLVCGNGGSAADAAHFATEFVVRFVKDRPSYPAICLSAEGGLLTAAGNDYGFDEIFARQVAGLGRSGDVLVALSSSGDSRNIVRALESAGAAEVRTIALLGRDGGKARGIAEIDLLVPGDSTARIQEGHMLLLHVICEAVEERLKGRVVGRGSVDPGHERS